MHAALDRRRSTGVMAVKAETDLLQVCSDDHGGLPSKNPEASEGVTGGGDRGCIRGLLGAMA